VRANSEFFGWEQGIREIPLIRCGATMASAFHTL
jgi:hypothetical protein